MRKLVLSMLLTFLLTFVAGSAHAQKPPSPAPPASTLPKAAYLQNNTDRASQVAGDDASHRVIVTLRVEAPALQGVSPAVADELLWRQAVAQAQDSLLQDLTAVATSAVKRFDYLPLLALTVDTAGLQTLAENPQVVAIAEDRLVPLALNESTPLIGAPAAWASGYTGSGQSIAILDSGVDKNHAFLQGKVVAEACFSTTNPPDSTQTVCPNGLSEQIGSGAGVNCATGIEGCFHGTHVAGIAAGRGSSFSGVAPDANIIAVQVFSRINSSAICNQMGRTAPCIGSYNSDQIKGLEYVYSLRNTQSIAAVNMSLGGGSYTSQTACDQASSAEKLAIDLLRSVGIASVISSGNDGYTNAMGSPGCISSAISVGSTDKSDGVSDYSNSASFLNLLAPGEQINSSMPGGTFDYLSGTSMAAPHVAGAWAVLRSKSPSATIPQILDALSSSGVMIQDWRNGITKPRIQVDAAAAALGGGGTTPTPTATPAPGGGALRNGDFEQGANGDWAEYSSTFGGTGSLIVDLVQMGAPVTARSGSHIAWLGGADNEISLLGQSVTLGSNPVLSFYYQVFSSDACGYDVTTVRVNGVDIAGMDLCAATVTTGWTLAQLDLAAYAGQLVDLSFYVGTDSSLPSSLLIDDVALSGSAAPTPTATPVQPTPTATPVQPTPTATPAQPTPTATPGVSELELSAQPGADNILLQWNPTNDTRFAGYRLSRAISGAGAFQSIAQALLDTTYFDADAALIAGTIYCYKVEALTSGGALIASSNIACAAFGRLELWAPDSVGKVGESVRIPVNVRNADGLQIGASDIWVDYDSRVLAFVKIERTPLTLEYAWGHGVTAVGGGIERLKIAAIYGDLNNPPPELFGNGSLFYATFNVKGPDGADSLIDLKEFIPNIGGSSIQNEDLVNIPLNLADGRFEADGNGPAAYILGDIDGDGVVRALDAALALRLAAGVRQPTAAEIQAGDVNGNGVIQAADASMILYYAVHGEWPPLPAETRAASTTPSHTTTLSLGNDHGRPGDTTQVTLRGDGLLGFAGGDFVVVYDPQEVARIAGVNATGLAAGMTSAYRDDGAGRLFISLADDAEISGSDALLTIDFVLADNAQSGQATPLLLAGAHLNDLLGRDFVTSFPSNTLIREHGELVVGLEGYNLYLPAVKR